MIAALRGNSSRIAFSISFGARVMTSAMAFALLKKDDMKSCFIKKCIVFLQHKIGKMMVVSR